MAGPFSERIIRVHRDALTTNWGFRLQGGKDFKAPLSVQRVFVGSPADGEIHRGDVIIAIENHDAHHMMHKEAMDLIKSAGGSLLFKVRRSDQSSRARTASPTLTSSHNTPQYIRSRPLETSTSKPAPPLGKYPTKTSMPLGGGGQSFGRDYSQPIRGYSRPGDGGGGGGGGAHGPNMMNRVQQSLETSLFDPGRDSGYDDGYQGMPVHDLRKAFQQNAPQYQGGNVIDEEEADDYPSRSVKDIRRQFNKPSYKTQSRPRPQLRFGNQSAFRKPAPRSPATSSFCNNPLPMFMPAAITQAARAQQNRPPGAVRPFVKPEVDLPMSMTEPGWTPRPASASAAPAHSYRPAPIPVNRPSNRPVHPAQEIHHFDDGPPAWAGSLRGSRGSRNWELNAQDNLVPGQHSAAPAAGGQRQRPAPGPVEHAPAVVTPHQPRVQTVHHGPGGSQTVGQHDGENYEGDAKVAHLQYNTPIGLYSKQNVNDTLEAQTHGKAGHGTMQVTGDGRGPKQGEYNPATSSVYQMIAEEEGRKAKPRGYGLQQQQQQQQQQQPQQQQPQQQQGGRGQQAPAQGRGGESARYQEHAPEQEMQYRGFQDHSRQSRSMHALEDFVANEGEGTSDF